MLWLCRTRQDIIQEIVQLQSEMVKPRGKDARQLNALLRRARLNKTMNGLHFCDVGPKRRLIQVTDSGHITSASCYPQEGRLVLLVRDSEWLRTGRDEYAYGADAKQLGGPTCSLFYSSKKAQRVSYSTSHSETNPAVSCAAVSNMIASRITELEFLPVFGRLPNARDLLEVHARSLNIIPTDMYTDAMNLWELICHGRTLPNDKNHRVGVLALREDRITRRIRNVIHIPTKIMLADQLTKRMLSEIFMCYCTTGIWNTNLAQDAKARIRRAARRPARYTEHELIANDFEDADGTVGDDLELDDFAVQMFLSLLN